MAVISKPYSARLRFINEDEDTIQSFSRVNPGLLGTQVNVIRQAINNIRRTNQNATGGFYTITDELEEA